MSLGAEKTAPVAAAVEPAEWTLAGRDTNRRHCANLQRQCHSCGHAPKWSMPPLKDIYRKCAEPTDSDADSRSPRCRRIPANRPGPSDARFCWPFRACAKNSSANTAKSDCEGMHENCTPVIDGGVSKALFHSCKISSAKSLREGMRGRCTDSDDEGFVQARSHLSKISSANSDKSAGREAATMIVPSGTIPRADRPERDDGDARNVAPSLRQPGSHCCKTSTAKSVREGMHGRCTRSGDGRFLESHERAGCARSGRVQARSHSCKTSSAKSVCEGMHGSCMRSDDGGVAQGSLPSASLRAGGLRPWDDKGQLCKSSSANSANSFAGGARLQRHDRATGVARPQQPTRPSPRVRP
jgi:hypothetical protein